MDAPEAQSLARLGAELVAVPLALGSKKELVNAFRGSSGAFLMTPPIAPPATHETELGKQRADAAVEAGVQHIVFSGLENVDEITRGKKFAPHFTDKAKVEEYIRTLPVISSFFYLAFFYTNLVEYYRPRIDGDTLVFPIYLPKDFRAPSRLSSGSRGRRRYTVRHSHARSCFTTSRPLAPVKDLCAK
jgi:NmrA-like family